MPVKLLYEAIVNSLGELPTDWHITDLGKFGNYKLWKEQQEAIEAGIKLLWLYYDEIITTKYTKTESDDVKKKRKHGIFQSLKTEDPSIANEPKLVIKPTDSLYAEMTQYFDEDTSSASLVE